MFECKVSISGFPELLPKGKLLKTQICNLIEKIANMNGFEKIETRSVEYLENILFNKVNFSNNKQIYKLSRYDDIKTLKVNKKNLILHFDLTLPTIRYINENCDKIYFPFRRYQIQKVWRGERSQRGRFREFTQVDFDIINKGSSLSSMHDLEILIIAVTILDSLKLLPISLLKLNNRKLIEGFLLNIHFSKYDISKILMCIDKVKKINQNEFINLLKIKIPLIKSTQIRKILNFTNIKCNEYDSFLKKIKKLNISNDLFQEGLTELLDLFSQLKYYFKFKEKMIEIDLSIVRGLEYYTGNVFETFIKNQFSYGSILSGGRYKNISIKNKKNQLSKYTGTGLSIGLDRLISQIINCNLKFKDIKLQNTKIMIIANQKKHWFLYQKIANTLRLQNISSEIGSLTNTISQQIKYAYKKKILFILFVKNIDNCILRNMSNKKEINVHPFKSDFNI